MRFNTKIPKHLKQAYNEELKQYSFCLVNKQYGNAWRYLERAHIIGQNYPYEHTLAHWKMFRFGFKIKSGKEILGQIPRLIFGGIKSFIGKIPVGNPGGANVPPLKPFPISKDLQDIFANP